MATRRKKNALGEDGFWKILGKLNWKKSGDDDAVLAPAIQALSKKSVAEIEGFADLLAEKLHAVDTREHARYGYLDEADPDDGDDFISADDFLYLRCCTVLNGRKSYERVLEDPSEMPRGLEFESVLYLAAQAYEAKTGEEFDYASATDFESFANKAGWKRTKEDEGRLGDEQEGAAGKSQAVIAVLPTRDAVILPGAVNELTVGRPGSIAAIRHAVSRDEPVLVVLQRKISVEDPGPGELHEMGTRCRIIDAERSSADSACVGVAGTDRVKILRLERRGDALFAEVEKLEWAPALPAMPEVLRETLPFLIDHGIRATFSARTLGALREGNDLERLSTLSIASPLDGKELQRVLERADLVPVVEALASLLDTSWLARLLRWIRK